MTEIGELRTDKPIDSAMVEIRTWLDRIGVKGMDVILQYDAKLNISLLKMKYKSKDYDFRSTKQRNCRLNMWAIARVMEYKVRSHLMKIEDFEKSMKAYLSLPNFTGQEAPDSETADVGMLDQYYKTLGVEPLASNEQISIAYKKLCKGFHPDNALSEEAKAQFTIKIVEINQAYTEIKKVRGL